MVNIIVHIMYILTDFCYFVFLKARFLKKDFIYLFLGREEGRKKRGRETSMCGCLSPAPHWGPGPQPRPVPWLGIEPVTLWFPAPVNPLSHTSQGWFLLFFVLSHTIKISNYTCGIVYFFLLFCEFLLHVNPCYWARALIIVGCILRCWLFLSFWSISVCKSYHCLEVYFAWHFYII